MRYGFIWKRPRANIHVFNGNKTFKWAKHKRIKYVRARYMHRSIHVGILNRTESNRKRARGILCICCRSTHSIRNSFSVSFHLALNIASYIIDTMGERWLFSVCGCVLFYTGLELLCSLFLSLPLSYYP